MFGEAQRGGVQLLLATAVAQERIAKLSGVPTRPIQRIGGGRLDPDCRLPSERRPADHSDLDGTGSRPPRS